MRNGGVSAVNARISTMRRSMHSKTMLSTLLSIFLASGLTAALAAQQASPATEIPARQIPDLEETVAKFDESIKAAVRYDQFSGSVLVARDGLPVFSKSYGMANYELNVPNTAQTVFRI